MNKTLKLTSLLCIIGLICFSITSCSHGGSPSAVIRQLHTAVEKGDTKTINELVVPEVSGLFMKMLGELQSELAQTGGIARMEEKINGDTAIVTVTYRNGDTEQYDLVKRNGKWKGTIDYSK